MKIGPRGQTLVQSFESCRLKAYQDTAGIWTIGWGHTRGVKDGDTCTQAQADEWLREELIEHEDQVSGAVKVPLNQNQFDALVSFVYNEGIGQFEHSRFLILLNRGMFKDAATQFDLWIYSGGHKTKGLIRRRAAERALFETPIAV